MHTSTVVVISSWGSSASQAPYLLDDGRHRGYLLEHRIGPRLQDLLVVSGLYSRAQHQNRDSGIPPTQLDDQIPAVPVGQGKVHKSHVQGSVEHLTGLGE